MSDDDDFMQESDPEQYVPFEFHNIATDMFLGMTSSTKMTTTRRPEMWILKTNITMQSR